MSLLRKFIHWQIRLSKGFDRIFLPESMRISGQGHFIHDIVPPHIKPKTRIYDIGGGSNPYFTKDQRYELQVENIGLDIDAKELNAAPDGTYTQTIVADLTRYMGDADADLAICQATMEHVKNTDRAFAAMASILKPGGTLLLFVPCRNAIFARLNLILPEGLKKKILFSIFPGKTEHSGFKAYYNRCTPQDFSAMAKSHGLNVIETHAYFASSYFAFFTPLYILWRIWVLIFRQITGDQAAESFSMVLIKPTSQEIKNISKAA